MGSLTGFEWVTGGITADAALGLVCSKVMFTEELSPPPEENLMRSSNVCVDESANSWIIALACISPVRSVVDAKDG